MNKLRELYEFPNNSIVSVIGSGGKSTLLLSLGNTYGETNRVLLSTTTHMYPIPSGVGLPLWENKDLPLPEIGIVVDGVFKEESQKLGSLPFEELEEKLKFFPYVFLEADGSRMRSLKGWAEYEPVIPSFTTHTVGVINLSQLGKPATTENIHRLFEFTKLTGCSQGEIITLQHITQAIQSPLGLFAKAVGKKLLFVSHCDTIEDVTLGETLLSLLDSNFLSSLDFVIGGNGKAGIGKILYRG